MFVLNFCPIKLLKVLTNPSVLTKDLLEARVKCGWQVGAPVAHDFAQLVWISQFFVRACKIFGPGIQAEKDGIEQDPWWHHQPQQCAQSSILLSCFGQDRREKLIASTSGSNTTGRDNLTLLALGPGVYKDCEKLKAEISRFTGLTTYVCAQCIRLYTYWLGQLSCSRQKFNNLP